MIPSAVKAIKTLINGEGNKIDEVIKIEKPKQDTVLSDQEAKNDQRSNRSMTALSDNELDLIAINRLIGKGFQIRL